MNIIFLSNGISRSCEDYFIKIRKLCPDIKRIHGLLNKKYALSICAAISDDPFFATIDGDYKVSLNMLSLKSIINSKNGEGLTLPKNIKIFQVASIKCLNKFPQKTLDKPNKLDIIYLTYDEPIADENFISIKLKYPYAMRLHRVTGMTKAFNISAYLAKTSWYILIDGDNTLLPTTNLNILNPPDKKFSNNINKTVLIYGARNKVNNLEYCYGGIKICPTLWFRGIKSDVVDPIASRGTLTVFKPKRVLSITNFNSCAYSAWKAGFREAVMLSVSCSIDFDKSKNWKWLSEYLNIWKNQGEDRPYGKYCIEGAHSGHNFANDQVKSIPDNLTKDKLKSILIDKLKVINDPKWLKNRYTKFNIDRSLTSNLEIFPNNITKKVFLRLCMIIGDNLDMLPHFIDHYQELGVEHFHIIIHAPNDEKNFYWHATEILSFYKIEPTLIYRGRWDGQIGTELINRIKKSFPEDWFIVADIDELQIHPEPIWQRILHLQYSQKPYLTGVFVDRISIDGALQPIIPNLSIWKQFPMAGFVSFPLAGATPYKITVCRGDIELSLGQHGIIDPKYKWPIKGKIETQVHHFKWSQNLLNNLKTRQEKLTKSIQLLNGGDQSYILECSKILSYFKYYNKIQINDPTFILSYSGKKYTDYLYWDEILYRTENWKTLQSSPKIDLD